MLQNPPLWFILIAFLCTIGPLVLIHEFGHYWVARRLGVGAEVFSIGFGREIAGWTDKRGTRWQIGWLPLGGYVRFVGDENEASKPSEAQPLSAEDRARSFHLRPVWQRSLIVLAGPLANFLVAIAIFAALFAALGMPRTSNFVSAVQAGSPAERAGIRASDRIVSVAGRQTDSFEDVQRIVTLRPGETVAITVQRGGSQIPLSAQLGKLLEKDRFGQSFERGLLGVQGNQRQFVRLSPLELIPQATAYTFTLTRWMIDGLWQIVSGRRSIKDIGGPIKIAQIAGQQASLGALEFIQLVALISINLGFINLLPVPMLDGGHLAFYAVEAVRRRPLSARALEWAFRGGVAVILALLVFTTVNDLGSIGFWDRLQRLIG
ncbi:RIP metalloprotease RseP [Sphingomonas lutea]|uniref:Zinc metalloprotease n=1 Tax=Sphingomonas lutea TaxID=1045317 RepID=A0A7G9SL64_9SPHN|nr:RIP metalloprotease RseP [Sphingomonas lutea]QNN68589.1 RIP metalloprotease RseP [Sphingomonas lutea]